MDATTLIDVVGTTTQRILTFTVPPAIAE